MRCFAILLLLVGVLGACAKEDSSTAGLPDDWPLPQLVLGEDWRLNRSVVALHKQQDSGFDERAWLVVFRSDSTLTESAQHVERCLRQSGFWKMRQGEGPSGFTSPDLRTYFSPDFYVEVKLGRYGSIKPAGVLGEDEYAVLVIDHNDPPEMLQVVLDLRQTNPEMANKVRDIMLEPL